MGAEGNFRPLSFGQGSSVMTVPSAKPTGGAIAQLIAAGERGDADAWMQLAVRHLVGTEVPRDLVTARAYLERAVAIGHVDAALMAIALTANGSGGPVDWRSARTQLHRAAPADPQVAGQHQAVLDAMDLNDEGYPDTLPTPERLSDAPSILRYPGLVSPAECQVIASSVADVLQSATVVDPATGRQVAHPIRTSDGAVVGPTRENLVIAAINRRLARASGTRLEQGEPLAVLRYAPGQQYRLHSDAIAGTPNQRIKTVLVYLNDSFEGGRTVFPDVGVAVTPRAGDAIVFSNTLPDGRPDSRARHAGEPVTRGVKWLATRWIRQDAIDPWTMGGAA